MKIIFYRNSAEPERVDKTLFITNRVEFDGDLKGTVDVTSPTITVFWQGVFDFNYAYIPDFNRYYYIDDMLLSGDNLWSLDLSCDVLMTYKEDIYKNFGVVGRQEFEYNSLMDDDSVPTESGYDLDIVEWNHLDDSDRDHKFIDLLTVIGSETPPQYVFTSIGGV